MPSFLNPFQGINKDIKLNNNEDIAQVARMSISSELEAVFQYKAYAKATRETYPKVSKIFEDLANEEETHIGELINLLAMANSKFIDSLLDGSQEVDNIIKEKLNNLKRPITKTIKTLIENVDK